jgi:uncharacterized protein YjbI with pentapeptide repeats
MWRFLLLLVACGAGLSINNQDDLSATPPDLAGVDFAGVDFATPPLLDLAGDDFAGIDLSVPDLASSDLAGADLKGVDLASVDIAAAPLPDLRGLDFAMPDFSGYDLISRDLAGTRPDFAGHDLNLTPFCAGTFVAGTCVEAFFAPLSLCFQPTGGCIVQTPGVYGTFCWPGGAEYQIRNDPDALRRHYLWGTNLCYTETVGGSGPSPSFTNAAGETLVFAPATGNYTCPNGSSGSIGANYGGCAQLQQMIAPDTGSCTGGLCP